MTEQVTGSQAPNSAGDITVALQSLSGGQTEAIEKVLPLVYRELRQLARAKLRHERPDHTLQPTALVHEVLLRILGSNAISNWEDRRHFFHTAATAMRRILIESARAKACLKRAGTVQLGDAAQSLIDSNSTNLDSLLDIDSCLEELEAEDSDAAELVKLRLYAGLSVGEAAEVMGISRTKAYEDWSFARFWFSSREI